MTTTTMRRLAPVALALTAGLLTASFAGAETLQELYEKAKAEKELDFTARPLEEGLRETLAHEMNLLGKS